MYSVYATLRGHFMHETQKEFQEKLQNIFCRFFNRKMTYFVRDKSKERDVFLVTNVPLETILLYDGAPQYSYHRMQIHDEAFLDDFYESFPLLKDADAIVSIMELTKAVKNSPDGFTLSTEGTEIHLKAKGETDYLVGNLLMTSEIGTYWNYYNAGILMDDDRKECPIGNDPITEKFTIWTVPIGDLSVKIILYPGYNIPDLGRYQKASKDTGKLQVSMGREKWSYLVNYQYDGTLLSSTGSQHGQRWYLLRNAV